MMTSALIKREEFNLWYELFKCSGGRMITDPIELKYSVVVYYEFDDVLKAIQFDNSFDTLTTPIIETRRTMVSKIKNKIKRWLK